MGKKGKKGGGKKGGGGGEERVVPPGALAMAIIRKGDTAELKDKFVVFQMNLMNWEYMNEEIVFKTSAHIWQVKDALRQLHGRVRDLRVAKKVFDPEHMLGDNYVELDDDEFADKTKHMTPQELSAFKAEQDSLKKKAMDMDMMTLEDYDLVGFAEDEEEMEEGEPDYPSWVRKLGNIKKENGQVRKNKDGGLEVVYQIFYDFKPVNHDDPLMLSHNSSGAEAEAKSPSGGDA